MVCELRNKIVVGGKGRKSALEGTASTTQEQTRVYFKNVGARTKRKERIKHIMDVRFNGGKTRRFRHHRASHEDRVKIKYQGGIDSDGAAFSGCYEGKLKLGQHVRQESGVGHYISLNLAKSGASLQGILKGGGSMPIVK